MALSVILESRDELKGSRITDPGFVIDQAVGKAFARTDVETKRSLVDKLFDELLRCRSLRFEPILEHLFRTARSTTAQLTQRRD